MSSPVRIWSPSLNRILCIVAAVLFLLAAFGVAIPAVSIVDLGLAFFAASFVL